MPTKKTRIGKTKRTGTRGTKATRKTSKANRAADAEMLATPEGVCVAMGGKWAPSAKGGGGVCTPGRRLPTLNVYRGNPCQRRFRKIEEFIFVPYTPELMEMLQQKFPKIG